MDHNTNHIQPNPSTPFITLVRQYALPIFLIVDAICINASLSLAIYFFAKEFFIKPFWGWGNAHLPIAFVFTCLWLFIFYTSEMYGRKLFSISQTLRSTTLAFLVIVTVTYFMGRSYAYPRTIFLLSWAFISLSVAGWRLFIRLFLWAEFGRQLMYKTTAIIGATNEGEIISQEIRAYPYSDHRLIGFVDDEKAIGEYVAGLPILGKRSEINDLIKTHYIDEFIIIRSSHNSYKEILNLIRSCDYPKVSFKVSPNTEEILLINPDIRHIEDIPLVDAMIGPTQNWHYRVKRVIDIGGTIIGLILFLPFFPIVALAIRLNSPGPIFYSQERVGKDGKTFKCIKFRSMHHNAEGKTGPVWATEDDPRVTRVGKILRRTSIDEIPQLINVLRGEMSLVGPRPERPFFVAQHSELQGIRLSVLPGLTGLSQVNGRYLQTIQERVKFDYYYIRNYSLWLDFEILFRTVGVVLSQKGAI